MNKLALGRKETTAAKHQLDETVINTAITRLVNIPKILMFQTEPVLTIVKEEIVPIEQLSRDTELITLPDTDSWCIATYEEQLYVGQVITSDNNDVQV